MQRLLVSGELGRYTELKGFLVSSTKKVKHLQSGDRIFLPQQQSIVTVTKVTTGVWDGGRAVGIKWAEGFTVLTEDDEVTFY